MKKSEQKYVNSLKEENERVKNMLMRFVEALGKLSNIDDVVNISLIPLMSEENQKIRAEIKAQAVNEVFEKVDEKLACHSFTSNSTEYTDGFLDCIEWVDSKLDELKKEMGVEGE